MPSLFKIPITQLHGVGEKKARLFQKLGVNTVGSLLRLYPRAYEDWSNPQKIADVTGSEACCIRARVEGVHAPARIRKNMTIFKIDVTDGTDRMTVTFFNQQYTFDKLCDGGEYLFYGYLKKNFSLYEMISPALAPVDGGIRIHPIYPQTANLTSKQIENAMLQALERMPEKTNDPIPSDILEEYGLCSLDDAIQNIHFPKNNEMLAQAKKRLAFEELLVLQLGMARLKGGRQHIDSHKISQDYTDEFRTLLPFEPTNAQKRAIAECVHDMRACPYPMNRLVQGDVGSGKTAVAAAVCYTVVKNGLQCAMMAPTEILAEQHYRSLAELFNGTDIKVGLLTGSMTAAQKRQVYADLQSGGIHIAVGTHALISDNVAFQNLGLVITDEQHRFGVAQRAALISKGENPHILVMSATPIPRTLALMIFGDLDLSVLDELPPGRQKVDTFLIDGQKRQRAYGFLQKHIENGNQCYIVCPLVEQSEVSDLVAAEEYVEKLKHTALAKYRIALLHGKMKAAEKERVMTAFSKGEIDILVSTTVIEVGVNVPSATIMMIENAERFGLSQLHQLRGRVGRGKDKSYCILVSDVQKESTIQRLKVMCSTNDGFKIADEDLRLRGPGDFFGSRQHGLPELKVVNVSDMTSLEDTQNAARAILNDDPLLEKKEHRGLDFETKRLFAKVGSTEQLQ